MHDPDERVVTGLVQITGDWEGAVSVQVAERLASTAAAPMFAMEIDEVTQEELNDTDGELVVMTVLECQARPAVPRPQHSPRFHPIAHAGRRHRPRHERRTT